MSKVGLYLAPLTESGLCDGLRITTSPVSLRGALRYKDAKTVERRLQLSGLLNHSHVRSRKKVELTALDRVRNRVKNSQ